MGAMSIWHWLILLLIVVLMFGKGKISDIMGDVAKGIKSFKKGMAEDEGEGKKPDAVKDPKVIENGTAGQAATQTADKSKVG